MEESQDRQFVWEIEPLIKANAQTEVHTQIDAYLAKCARHTEATPSGCPFSSSYGYAESGRWTVDKEPTILFQYDEDDGQLYATTSEAEKGQATFSYEDFYYGVARYPVEFSVSGPVSVVGGRIIWQPDTQS
jgi:hypothetical protein